MLDIVIVYFCPPRYICINQIQFTRYQKPDIFVLQKSMTDDTDDTYDYTNKIYKTLQCNINIPIQ